MICSQGTQVTKAIPEGRKHVMGNEHGLYYFNDMDAVDKIFREPPVIRERQRSRDLCVRVR